MIQKKKTTTKKRACSKRGLGMTSTTLDQLYPMWNKAQTNEKGGHTTQRTNTDKTYIKIGNFLKKNMPNAKILDASSGLGAGTKALRDMGFNVEDVEPHVDAKKRSFKATYTEYTEIRKKYDVVISNAVLNVIPDDWRDDLLRKMSKFVAIGGRIIINVRDAGSIASQSQKKTLDRPSEILVLNAKGQIIAYQRGFTTKELKEYCEKILGSGWRVVTATVSNSGINGTAVVCYKEK